MKSPGIKQLVRDVDDSVKDIGAVFILLVGLPIFIILNVFKVDEQGSRYQMIYFFLMICVEILYLLGIFSIFAVLSWM